MRVSAWGWMTAAVLGLLLAGCGNEGVCGDGLCTPSTGESCASCAADCGACMGDCSPESCAGCCMSGVCEAGSSSSACGSRGSMCTVCGADFACPDGACWVDPASRWNLVLDRLTIPTTNLLGGTWDILGGAADPVVDVRVGSAGGEARRQDGPDDVHMIDYPGTPIHTDIRAIDLLAYIEFRVADEDETEDEFVGACFTDRLRQAVFVGEIGRLRCVANPETGMAGFELTYHLEPF